jgi:hypothetical protein
MKMPWTNRQGAAKAIAICVTVLLVSAGLCGMQLLVLNLSRGSADGLTTIFMITGALELIAILLSVLIGFIALLIWGFGSLFRRDRDS